MSVTEGLKLVVDPDFKGKELVIGSPGEFDDIRIQKRRESSRTATVLTVPDFANYMHRWADRDVSTVYCGKDSIVGYLNEEDRLQSVKYSVTSSTAFDQWKKAMTGAFDQGGFKKFIERRVGDIVDGINLLNVIENLKLTTTIEHSGQFDNDLNYGVVFKESTGGESAVKIPKHVVIDIPLSEGDSAKYRLTLELQLQKPKSSDEKFLFALKCHELEDVLNAAMHDRIAQVLGLLDGWNIYAGSAS